MVTLWEVLADYFRKGKTAKQEERIRWQVRDYQTFISETNHDTDQDH